MLRDRRPFGAEAATVDVPAGELVACFDLGSSKVACALGSVNHHGNVSIQAIGTSWSRGIERGIITDMDRAVEAVREAAHNAGVHANAGIPSAVTLSGTHVSSLISHGKLPPARTSRRFTSRDADTVLQNAEPRVMTGPRQIVHIIPRLYTVDQQGGIRSPVGMYGRALEVEAFVAMADANKVASLSDTVRSVVGVVDETVLASLASGLAVLTEDEREAGVCVLDIGQWVTDVAVFSQGTIRFASVVPLGGEHITNDIAQIMRLRRDEAERHKVESGLAVTQGIGETEPVYVQAIGETRPRPFRKRAFCEIIAARAEEIFGEVKNLLDTNQLSSHIPRGVVITGGGAKLGRIAECARMVLNVPARVAVPNILALQGRTERGVDEALAGAEYATVVGGLLWLADLLKQADQKGNVLADFLADIWHVFTRRVPHKEGT